jgi:hypothetical protein
MKQFELYFTNFYIIQFICFMSLIKIKEYEKQKMGWQVNAGYAGIVNGDVCFHYCGRLTFLVDWVWNRFGKQTVYTILTFQSTGLEYMNLF